MDKQVLAGHVKKWIELDNKIQAAQKVQQQLKKDKKEINDKLIEIFNRKIVNL